MQYAGFTLFGTELFYGCFSSVSWLENSPLVCVSSHDLEDRFGGQEGDKFYCHKHQVTICA